MEIMIDLETLSTNPNSIILTIGAIAFSLPDIKNQSIFYRRVDLKSYESYINNEFSFNWDTLVWWLGQNKEALDEAFLKSPRFPIEVALRDLVDWIDHSKGKIIWSHGKDFDIVILQNAFKVCGIKCPWEYYNTRDTRTIYALANINLKDIPIPEGYTAHNAVGDCLKQIEGLKQSYDIINKKNDNTRKRRRKL